LKKLRKWRTVYAEVRGPALLLYKYSHDGAGSAEEDGDEDEDEEEDGEGGGGGGGGRGTAGAGNTGAASAVGASSGGGPVGKPTKVIKMTKALVERSHLSSLKHHWEFEVSSPFYQKRAIQLHAGTVIVVCTKLHAGTVIVVYTVLY
jgi:hypothetical protein